LQTTAGVATLGVAYAHLEAEEYRRGGSLGGFSTYVRWSDLSAPKDFRVAFDPIDLKRPEWSIQTTNAASYIMIESVGNGRWPTTPRPNEELLEVASDFAGWRKIKSCDDCSSVNYRPVGAARDVDHIYCDPPLTPVGGHACEVYARVEGANLRVLIPLLKLEEYRVFLLQAGALMRRFREMGRKECS
jgi:hypothetical protein